MQHACSVRTWLPTDWINGHIKKNPPILAGSMHPVLEHDFLQSGERWSHNDSRQFTYTRMHHVRCVRTWLPTEWMNGHIHKNSSILACSRHPVSGYTNTYRVERWSNNDTQQFTNTSTHLVPSVRTWLPTEWRDGHIMIHNNLPIPPCSMLPVSEHDFPQSAEMVTFTTIHQYQHAVCTRCQNMTSYRVERWSHTQTFPNTVPPRVLAKEQRRKKDRQKKTIRRIRHSVLKQNPHSSCDCHDRRSPLVYHSVYLPHIFHFLINSLLFNSL